MVWGKVLEKMNYIITGTRKKEAKNWSVNQLCFQYTVPKNTRSFLEWQAEKNTKCKYARDVWYFFSKKCLPFLYAWILKCTWDNWNNLVSRKRGSHVNFPNISHISRIVNHIRQVPKTRCQKTWVLILRNQIIPFLHVHTQSVKCCWRKTTHWPTGLTLNSWSGLPWQVQWLRVPLPLQGVWVWSLLGNWDPEC